MSSPHLAGSAALVRALQPTWLPSEVKSALMMTSFNGGFKENGTTPWDPDDVGTGRVDLNQVAKAGLVMNETFANYLAANPATGGDPRTLNIPSVRDMNCTPNCVLDAHGAQYQDRADKLDRHRIGHHCRRYDGHRLATDFQLHRQRCGDTGPYHHGDAARSSDRAGGFRSSFADRDGRRLAQ